MAGSITSPSAPRQKWPGSEPAILPIRLRQARSVAWVTSAGSVDAGTRYASTMARVARVRKTSGRAVWSRAWTSLGELPYPKKHPRPSSGRRDRCHVRKEAVEFGCGECPLEPVSGRGKRPERVVFVGVLVALAVHGSQHVGCYCPNLGMALTGPEPQVGKSPLHRVGVHEQDSGDVT